MFGSRCTEGSEGERAHHPCCRVANFAGPWQGRLLGWFLGAFSGSGSGACDVLGDAWMFVFNDVLNDVAGGNVQRVLM